MVNTKYKRLQQQIAEDRNKLLSHPIYSKINDLKGLQKFTQFHVFAVWDFMSLLKSLQISLTSVSLPWMPKGLATTRYLINEIVLGEESDIDEFGSRISHFELYIKAMQQLGADTFAIHSLIASIQSGKNIFDAINDADIHDTVKQFLSFTFDVAINKPVHIKAAVFTFGREDLIPSMFHELLLHLYNEMPEKVSTLKYYIERHIEVDGDHHSHLAIQMVNELCEDDDQKWDEATLAAKRALEIRYLLWDAVIS